MTCMGSAISDLSCYMIIVYKTEGKSKRELREPDHAILANLLFPYIMLHSIFRGLTQRILQNELRGLDGHGDGHWTVLLPRGQDPHAEVAARLSAG